MSLSQLLKNGLIAICKVFDLKPFATSYALVEGA